MPHARTADPAVTSPLPLGPVYSGVLDMIGRTPMLELRKLDTGPCRLFAKLELMNPAGSIKDRIGLRMIEDAERDGRLDPNATTRPTIIEATAGNTGLALALVAGQRGYDIKVVVPDKMSQEKIQHLTAMGAEVVLARSDVQKGHPDYYQEVAARLAEKTPNSIYINQFENESNIAAHYDTTGPEVWEQLAGKVDAIVLGVGSGGTLSGMGKYLREKNPNLKIVLADPAESILNPLVNEGKEVEPGSWLIEGMGEDFIPKICDLDLCDEAIPVTDRSAFHMARELLYTEGMLAGSSTGCLLAAACAWCQKQTEPLNVVSLICDNGAKYLSKMFNDFWMIDNGFIERETRGDLSDLIARRHLAGEDYTLSETEPVAQAIKRMGQFSVSQMVVMDHRDRIAGIIDESDILLAVLSDREAFEKPVSDFMTRRIETVRPDRPVEDLVPIFRADRVAIVVDAEDNYLGLITKIDMINYLRNQLV
jgi:cystathionine beta-synthase